MNKHVITHGVMVMFGLALGFALWGSSSHPAPPEEVNTAMAVARAEAECKPVSTDTNPRSETQIQTQTEAFCVYLFVLVSALPVPEVCQ